MLAGCAPISPRCTPAAPHARFPSLSPHCPDPLRQRLLPRYLTNAVRRLERKKGAIAALSQRGLSIGTVALITGLVALFINAVVLSPVLPLGDPVVSMCAWLVVISAGLGLLFMYRTAFCDPGVLTVGLEGKGRGRANGNRSSSRVDLPTLWAGNWGSLCVSCKIVRPLGSKHCAVLNKCVLRFDHYCPWVGNTVGKGNLRDFVVFLSLESVALAASVFCAFYRREGTARPVSLLFFPPAWISCL